MRHTVKVAPRTKQSRQRIIIHVEDRFFRSWYGSNSGHAADPNSCIGEIVSAVQEHTSGRVVKVVFKED